MSGLGYESDEVKGQEMSDARISAQLHFMSEQLEKTHAMISELQVALEPILLPEINRGTAVDGPDSLPSSEISRLIDLYNGSLADIQQRIMGLKKRVQL